VSGKARVFDSGGGRWNVEQGPARWDATV
jgi:hypothetical protein